MPQFKRKALEGVFPLMPLCLKENQEIDYDAFRFNADLLAQRGMNGFIVFGAMGQFNAPSEDEFNRVCDVCVKAAKENDLACVIGATSIGNTKEAIRRATYAEAAGADGSMICLPYAFPITAEWAMEFFQMVNDSLKGEIAIMLYDSPGYTGLAITPELWEKHLFKMESIKAVKESNYSIVPHDDLVLSIAHRVNVFCGCESPFWDDALRGAKGVVGQVAWVTPKLVAKYYKECTKGNQKDEWTFKAYQALARATAVSHGPRLLEYEHGTINTLVEMGGGKAGPPRKPYGRLPSHEKKDLEESVQPLIQMEREM
jgi:dihydrodipicolinate synthase/N-acetylneuraminate lyase